MEIFLSLWNNWTATEKLTSSLSLLFILVVLVYSVYFLTKNLKLTIFSAISLLFSGLISTLTIWISNLLFDITVTYIFQLIPLVVIFIQILNIGTCVGYFRRSVKRKDFSFDEVKKEFLKDTLQLTIFIVLLFSAISVFISSTLLTMILLSAIISLLSIWFNFLVLYRFVK